MKKWWKLTKAIMWNEGTENPADKKKGVLYRFFGVLAMAMIIVPSCLLVGYISYIMTLALIETGGNAQGLLFILHFLSLTAVVFGFQVVLTTFYFSSDVEHLLPLPLKISEIIWVKFLKTYFAESAMEVLIIISALIGYFIAAPVSIAGILAAVIGSVTVPLLPLLWCGVLSVLLLYFTTWIRSGKQVSILVWTVATGVTVFAFWAIGGLSGLEVENFVESMMSGSSVFMRSMGVIFFQNVFLTDAMGQGSFLSLGLYIFCNICGVAVFLGLANLMYLPGLWRVSSVGNKGRKMTEKLLVKKSRRHAAHISYLWKEVRILLRTGSYVANCVMMTYVWPAVIGIFLLWKGRGEVLTKYRIFYWRGWGGVDIIVLVLMLAIAVLTPGANAIAATVFTREGKHIDFMKYIPVSYKVQIRVKAGAAILISYSSVLLSDLWIAIYLRMSPLKLLYFWLVSFWAVVLVTALGVWLDGMHPRLTWEDETTAMRGNLNVFFNMAFSMILGGGLCLLAYCLYVPTTSGSLVMHILFLALLMAGGICSYRYAVRASAAQLEEIN